MPIFESMSAADSENLGLSIDCGDSDEERGECPGSAHMALASQPTLLLPSIEPSSPMWQQVNWSLTETDSSTALSSQSLSFGCINEDVPGADMGTRLSPPRFAALTLGQARRRNPNIGLVHSEDVSDISDEENEGSFVRDPSRKRSKQRRPLYWTPFRGLMVLFVVTAYTIFGIPDDDLTAELVVQDPLVHFGATAVDNLVPESKAQIQEPPFTVRHATSALLPQPAHSQLPNPHKLHYAVKQHSLLDKRGLTFKQQQEVERFYHQPALHSSLATGRVYYAVALLGVVCWAVRVHTQASSSHAWRPVDV